VRPSKPIRPVRGGYQARVSLNDDRIYLGTYDTEDEARYAHHAAKMILGIADQSEAPTLGPEAAAAIVEKVKARLRAHASRPGKHHRSDALVRRDSTTGYKGVTMFPRPWRAHIAKGNRRYSLGTYPTATEAAVAYNLAASILHGPDALLNRISPANQPSEDTTDAIRRQIYKHLGILLPGQPTPPR
jgi:hypothetical protein